jgi:hypothetical protein
MTASSFGGLTGLSGISAAFDSLFGNLKSVMPTDLSAARSASSLFFRCRAVRSRTGFIGVFPAQNLLKFAGVFSA